MFQFWSHSAKCTSGLRWLFRYQIRWRRDNRSVFVCSQCSCVCLHFCTYKHTHNVQTKTLFPTLHLNSSGHIQWQQLRPIKLSYKNTARVFAYIKSCYQLILLSSPKHLRNPFLIQCGQQPFYLLPLFHHPLFCFSFSFLLSILSSFIIKTKRI